MEEYQLEHTFNRRMVLFTYILFNIAVFILLCNSLDNFRQTMAGSVFIALVVGTLAFWRFRVAIAFVGIVILLVTKTIDLNHTIEYMNLDVILFLIGMMIVVGLLKRAHFFRWFLAKGLEYSRFRPFVLLIIFLSLSALMAALVDEVTSILFTTTLVLDFCKFFKVRPVKPIISVILATNIGSSWTVLGNPIGILIALRSGLTFEDFIKVPFPIGVVSLISVIIVILLWLRKDLKILDRKIKHASKEEQREFLDKLEKIDDKKLFWGSFGIFISVIILLAVHYRLENMLGLEHNTLLVASSIFGAGIAMLWQRDMARDLLERDVDWWTLVFFMFLFAKAGALKFVGVTELVGKSLIQVAGAENHLLLIILVLWLSAFASAIADNVVIVATLIPVLQHIFAHAPDNSLWWALLLGGCYGGNMTIVGSTANIVALGILENREKYHMTLTYWLKIGFWGAIIPLLIATIALAIISTI